MSQNWKSYYVNVAVVLRGREIAPFAKHYCRIELPDTLTNDEAKVRAREIADRFGEGFECTLSRTERVGYPMEID